MEATPTCYTSICAALNLNTGESQAGNIFANPIPGNGLNSKTFIMSNGHTNRKSRVQITWKEELVLRVSIALLPVGSSLG